ncbi:MAG TPA: protein-tyrosine-phosphatase [Acetobacteraceae bacterium]|jgi:ArsR family transcriptional regulator, arsenate/arsenite/antimonite-responsive transcriptional repressor / arsenate reductase (thioredoxin)|nr:protein-tyrosine-phosphatase [Acetobacteraceae bacterium]
MEISEIASAFTAMSQEVRLELLRLLIGKGPTGLAAGDIAVRLGLSPSKASFHLAALERAGLTQSTRQGRQIIHAVRFVTLRRVFAFLTEACCDGRPDLCGDIARLLPPLPTGDETMTAAFNVLFLCTHNSARSIIAEAILGSIANGRFHAYSAGSEPNAAPNPEVLAKLANLGHDTAALRSKSWDEFTGPNAPRMDFIITLCDALDGQVCPDFGSVPVTGSWPLPDPSKFMGSAVERAALINELYASLRRRLDIFTALPFASLDRIAVKARLDEIGGGGVPVSAGER